MNKKNFMYSIMLIVYSCTTNNSLSQTFWVTSNADSGLGSVRQAIVDLNSSVDATNEIRVSLAGNVEVLLESNLPAIEKPVTFDGQDFLSPFQLTLDGNNAADIGLEIAPDTQIGSDLEVYLIKNTVIANIVGDSAVGITNATALLIIDNCTVTNITAQSNGTSGTGGSGGSAGSVTTAIGIKTGLQESAEFTNAVAIVNTTVQNIHNENSDGDAYGIVSSAAIFTVENSCIQDVRCKNNTQNVISAGIFYVAMQLDVGQLSINIISNTIQNIFAGEDILGSNLPPSNSAYGIRIDSDIGQEVKNNTISHVGSSAADTSQAEGISLVGFSNSPIECNDNVISYIVSGNATSNSSANGLFIDQVDNVECRLNTISNLASKEGTTSSITGISLSQSFLGSLTSSLLCNENTIFDIDNTLVDNATATGIFIGNIGFGNQCNANTITNLTASQEATGICIDIVGNATLIGENNINTITAKAAFGIKINNSNGALISESIIENITSTLGSAYGILLGSEGSALEENENNLLVDNNIKHVTGPQGFGITLLNQNANNNKLSINLICDITTKTIDIGAETDAVCKIFHATLLSNGDLQVQGILNDVAFINEMYTLEFYVNDCNTIPQTPLLINDFEFIPISDPAPFDLIFTPLVPVQVNQYITMIATQVAIEINNKNTSEVSNTRRVRITSINAGAICMLVCPNDSDEGSCCIINK